MTFTLVIILGIIFFIVVIFSYKKKKKVGPDKGDLDSSQKRTTGDQPPKGLS